MEKKEISRIILGTGNYQNVKCGNTVSITGDGGNAWVILVLPIRN